MILVRAVVLLGLVICGAQAQVLTDDVDPDLELQLKRSTGDTADSSEGYFGEHNTVALDGDTLAVGAPRSTAACAGGDANLDQACILDPRMAGQLVTWFGNYEYTLRYSGSRDGWTAAAFQAAMLDEPTIVVAYSYRDASQADRGAYVFGGYTTTSWKQTDYKRCADTANGGAGTSDACSWWDSCTSDSDCTSYSECGCCLACGNTCGGGGGCPTCACSPSTCLCCANNECVSVCAHVADPQAYLYRLMNDGNHDFVRYPSAGTGNELFVCSTFGPTFGPESATLGEPPYTDYALKLDIAGRGGSVGTSGFVGLGTDQWAVSPPPLPRTNRTSLVPPLVLSGHAASLTPYLCALQVGHKTDWYLDELEVYGVRQWRVDRGLFQFAPGGSGAGGDNSVSIFPPPPLLRTNRTRRVLHLVLIGHAASLRSASSRAGPTTRGPTSRESRSRPGRTTSSAPRPAPLCPARCLSKRLDTPGGGCGSVEASSSCFPCMRFGPRP